MAYRVNDPDGCSTWLMVVILLLIVGSVTATVLKLVLMHW